MNREIKFRFWHTIDKEWVNPALIEFDYDSPDAELIGVPIYLYGKENVEQNIIYQQYAGLKDKDGREIYEGDIVNIEYNRLGNKVVAFNEGKCNLCGYNLSKCSVIGNIYENPELL